MRSEDTGTHYVGANNDLSLFYHFMLLLLILAAWILNAFECLPEIASSCCQAGTQLQTCIWKYPAWCLQLTSQPPFKFQSALLFVCEFLGWMKLAILKNWLKLLVSRSLKTSKSIFFFFKYIKIFVRLTMSAVWEIAKPTGGVVGTGELGGLELVLALDQLLCDFRKFLNLSVSFFLFFFSHLWNKKVWLDEGSLEGTSTPDTI